MVKVKRRLYITYLIVFILIIIGFIYLNYQTTHAKPITYTQSSADTDIEERDLYIEMPSSKNWKEGTSLKAYQFDATVFNNTQYYMSDWYVKFKLPSNATINDSWGMTIENDEEGNTVVTAFDYNFVLESNGNIGFGFIIFSPTEVEFNDFEISAVPEYQFQDFPLYYILFALNIILIIAVVSTVIVVIMDKSYKKRREHDKQIIIQSMKTFSNFIDTKDPYTKGHSARVAYYSKKMAEQMDFTEEEIDNIYYIGLLHDVGKVIIPDDILNKPAKLTPDERKVIETHTEKGATILKDFTAINSIIEGALYHHERFDGQGYPHGITGEEIPLIARIICVADSYDAMSSDRCYRKALSKEEIVKELEANCDKQFDSAIVQIMLKLIEENAFDDIHEYIV